MKDDARFWVFGGMKFNQGTRLHIANDDWAVICGVKSKWMEAGTPVNNKGFIQGQEHLPPIQERFTCKKCLSIWNKLKYDQIVR